MSFPNPDSANLSIILKKVEVRVFSSLCAPGPDSRLSASRVQGDMNINLCEAELYSCPGRHASLFFEFCLSIYSKLHASRTVLLVDIREA